MLDLVLVSVTDRYEALDEIVAVDHVALADDNGPDGLHVGPKPLDDGSHGGDARAGTVRTAAPLILMVLVLQRRFIGGLTAGSVKDVG